MRTSFLCLLLVFVLCACGNQEFNRGARGTVQGADTTHAAGTIHGADTTDGVHASGQPPVSNSGCISTDAELTGSGVGTPIAELLELPEVRGWTGEGNLVVVSPRHCGLSFQVDRGGVQPPSGGEWDRATLAQLPNSATAELVRIVGCENSPL